MEPASYPTAAGGQAQTSEAAVLLLEEVKLKQGWHPLTWFPGVLE